VRLTIRLLLLLPLAVIAAQLCGLVYSQGLAVALHSVLEPTLVIGWSLDEALKGLPALAAGGLVLAGAAAMALLLGVLPPLRPAAGEEPAAVGLQLARLPAGLAVCLVLGTMGAFGLASAPLFFAVVAGASAAVRPPDEPVRPRLALGGVLGATAVSLLFVANMMATPRTGTFLDAATSALATPVAWWVLATLLVAAQLLAGRAGMPLLPDLATWPGRWPWQTGRLALIAAAAIAVDSADVVRCPDVDAEGVRLVSDDRAAFDLDVDGAGHLVVVHREEAWVRAYDLDSDGAAELLHELGGRRGGDLEEAYGLPGGRGVLVTEILDDEPKTILLLVDPSTGAVREGEFAGMCWISSLAWDEERGEVLLGCETSADLLALDVDAWSLRHVGQLEVWDDSEDIALRTDRSAMYLVSLAEGDRLRQVDPDTAATLRSAPLGGFNYSGVHDPASGRVIAARFHDSQLVAFSDDTLEVVDRARVGLGVRPAVGIAGGRLAVASQLGAPLRIVRAADLKTERRLRLGGRVKSLATSPAGDRVYLSSACGTFEVDVGDGG